MSFQRLASQVGARWHVLLPEMPWQTRCGLPTSSEPGMATPTVAAREVPQGDRCRGPGCRGNWPPELRLVSGGST